VVSVIGPLGDDVTDWGIYKVNGIVCRRPTEGRCRPLGAWPAGEWRIRHPEQCVLHYRELKGTTERGEVLAVQVNGAHFPAVVVGHTHFWARYPVVMVVTDMKAYLKAVSELTDRGKT
jgi:hypothetical protein